jgi:amidase
MISQADYMAHDALGLAALVQRGEVHASELLEAAIARAEAVNPRLNAIVIHMYDIARERAKAPLRGPFAGVPFLIKDLFQDYAGVLATHGSRAYKRVNNTPRVHSEIVRRWLDAGAVIFGRTNTPEFGAKGVTEPEAWGPTRNPWDLAHSPGGSSGGAAAAVAAGIVPMAGASDGAGSIRIPSAYTGLFGFKPGRGRTPMGPDLGEIMHGAAVNHVIARSVRDSAAMLDATIGRELGSPFLVAPPERPYLEEVRREPGRLRIAWSVRSPLGSDVDPAAQAAVMQTAKLLEALGHHVEPAEPAIDGMMLARDFLRVWFAYFAHHAHEARVHAGARDADFELDSLAVEAMGRATHAPAYVESYQRWGLYGSRLAELFTRYDVYLTPTIALPAPLVGSTPTPPWAAKLMDALIPLGGARLLTLGAETIRKVSLENLRCVPFTQLANLTGVPAMSLPLHAFRDGMPLGVQFLADHGGEGRLFSLAAQLEQAAPWSERRPSLQ